jgi:hypothetical protein
MEALYINDQIHIKSLDNSNPYISNPGILLVGSYRYYLTMCDGALPFNVSIQLENMAARYGEVIDITVSR